MLKRLFVPRDLPGCFHLKCLLFKQTAAQLVSNPRDWQMI